MKEISDDQLLLVLTITELMGKSAQPHDVRLAYFRANQRLQAYKSDPASKQPIED